MFTAHNVMHLAFLRLHVPPRGKRALSLQQAATESDGTYGDIHIKAVNSHEARSKEE